MGRVAHPWQPGADVKRTGGSLAYFCSLPAPPVTTSDPRITSSAQYILNDTSLAALGLPSGERQMFFQGNNGSIRRATRTASDEQWVISPYFYLSASSKQHTPLAVTVYNMDDSRADGTFSADVTTVNI